MVRDVLRTGVILLGVAWIFAAVQHAGSPPNPLARQRIAELGPEQTESNEPVVEQAEPSDLVPTDSAPTDSAPTDSAPSGSPLGEAALDDAFADPNVAAHEPVLASPELLASIRDYVDTPKDGMDWRLFGKTKQRYYSYTDKTGMKWRGVKPEFPDELKRFDGKTVLVKGFMFPLGQQEKQPRFLLGPFPVSCPYHYDVTPSLIVEVHAQEPVRFSYEAVSVKGKLELVPQDDEFNVFYRLKAAKQTR